mgnify:CR=1 FL=1|jgi:hypothetical protein
MKIIEITEAPFSRLLAKNKALQAKMLGKVPGMGDRADNMTARADMKATANGLYNKFSKYVGGQGKKLKQATGEDLAAFMKTMNYNGVTAKGDLDKATLNSELTKAAKHAMAGNKPSGAKKAAPVPGGKKTAPRAKPQTQQSNPNPPTLKGTNKTGGKVRGQVSQTPNAVRKRAARAKAKTISSAPQIDLSALQSQIKKLSPQDRQRLLKSV